MRVSRSKRAHVAIFGALPSDRLRALYLDMAGLGGQRGAPALKHFRRFAVTGQGKTAPDRLERIAEFADAFGGSKGKLYTNPITTFSAAAGLRQVGLEADTRRLAVETALAAGL
jgi:hypothetical protein